MINSTRWLKALSYPSAPIPNHKQDLSAGCFSSFYIRIPKFATDKRNNRRNWELWHWIQQKWGLLPNTPKNECDRILAWISQSVGQSRRTAQNLVSLGGLVERCVSYTHIMSILLAFGFHCNISAHTHSSSKTVGNDKSTPNHTCPSKSKEIINISKWYLCIT